MPDAARVEPPAEHRDHGWHWLQTREHGPIVALWEGDLWWFSGDKGERPPGILARAGWRYLAPCLPPEPTDAP